MEKKDLSLIQRLGALDTSAADQSKKPQEVVLHVMVDKLIAEIMAEVKDLEYAKGREFKLFWEKIKHIKTLKIRKKLNIEDCNNEHLLKNYPHRVEEAKQRIADIEEEIEQLVSEVKQLREYIREKNELIPQYRGYISRLLERCLQDGVTSDSNAIKQPTALIKRNK